MSGAEAAVREAPVALGRSQLYALFGEMVRRGASDLHLRAGRRPMLRVNGALEETDLTIVSQDDLQRSLGEVLSPSQRQRFAEHKELDFAIGVPGLGRFRINLFWERGSLAFSIRAVPSEVPRLESLGLPRVLADIALSPRGLVLVTGITGSGKSTTLAAMIRHVNENRSVNIVGIEDPVEFVHPDLKAIVAQREVGSDTLSFHDALRHVLRQDPDVILLGEIRDADSMETLLKAAETGHLVFSTLHTTDAAQTISRILSFFPPHQQNEVRAMLASALRAVISLRLVPRSDGSGRVPAAEVLVNTAAIADRIRQPDPAAGLDELMAEGNAHYGMQTFDQSLMGLYRSGAIAYDAAMFYATNPSEFALRASGVAAGSAMQGLV